MNWFVLAISAVFLYSISSLIQRVLMKDEKSDAHLYSVAFQILLAIVVAIATVFTGFHLPPISKFPLNFLFLAILYGSGTLFLFNAYKFIEASEVSILTSIRAIVTIVAAVLLLGENFDFKKIIGTVLILISVFLISNKIDKVKFNKGLLYVLGMSICYGLAFTNDAYLLRHVEAISFLVISSLFPGLFLIAVKPKSILKLSQFLKVKIFSKMLTLAIFYSLAAIFTYIAIQKGGEASQVMPILQTTVIVTVILSAIFLNERDNLIRKFISAILVSLGIFLIK